MRCWFAKRVNSDGACACHLVKSEGERADVENSLEDGPVRLTTRLGCRYNL